MSVTVSDVLQLDILNSAKVIAGKNGLDREVLRINFTDCPINPLVDADLILSGDAFICSLGQFTRNYTQTTKRGLLTTNKG